MASIFPRSRDRFLVGRTSPDDLTDAVNKIEGALSGEESLTGDLLFAAAAEQGLRIRRTDLPDQPTFSIGRVVLASDGAYLFRGLYSDDATPEHRTWEFDSRGIVGSVRQTLGVHFEGFLDGDTFPRFRLHSDGNGTGLMQLEMGRGGDDIDSDIWIRRAGAGELAFLVGAAPVHVLSLTAGAAYLTGQLVATISGDDFLVVSRAAGTNRFLSLTTAGTQRWKLGAGSGAEGGGNSGSPFELHRYSDAGAHVEKVLSVARDTGVTTLVSGSEDVLALSRAAGNARLIDFQTALSPRWKVGASATAEGGSNAGSNLEVYRYADDGSFLDTALSITRASGAVNIAAGLVVAAGGATLTTGNLGVAAGYADLGEIAAPGSAPANTARLYAEDDGAGKTRLMVVFASGAAQQVAIQP